MRLSKSHSVSLRRRLPEVQGSPSVSPKRSGAILRSSITKPAPSTKLLNASFLVAALPDSSTPKVSKSSPKFRRTKTKLSPRGQTKEISETHSNNRLRGSVGPKPRLPRDQSSFEQALNVSGLVPVKTPKKLLNLSFTPRQTRISLPASGKVVSKAYEQELTEFERTEVLGISEVYYVGKLAVKNKPMSQEMNHGFDDARGDYILTPGDHLYYRYQIVSMLGKGSFGQVCKCIDHKTKSTVAVKLIKNKKRLYVQGQVEAKALETLRGFDPEDRKGIVRILGTFTFRAHLCIVFEQLCYNLYELLKSRSFKGLSMTLCKKFARQLLVSLDFTRKNRIIHCDLKPENVMLSKPTTAEIKLIDFGSCCFSDSRIYTYIQSRFYRAPEVILGIPYTTQIDIWSFGCIMAELFTGTPLFAGETEHEQMLCVMEAMGVPPLEFVAAGSRFSLFFMENGEPKVVPSKKGKLRIPGSKSLGLLMQCDDTAFLDFLTKCFQWVPEARLTPEQGLLHPWLGGL